MARKMVGTAASASTDIPTFGQIPKIEIPPFSDSRTVLTVQSGTARWYNPHGRTLTIQSVRASVGTQPTGAAIIVDVKKNGTSIFATTTANRPTIAVSTNSAVAGTPDTTTISSTDYLTVDILQVGSTVAGGSLTVQIVVT